MRRVIVLLIFTLFTSAALASEPTSDPELQQLAAWMTGSFSSEAQSLE